MKQSSNSFPVSSALSLLSLGVITIVALGIGYLFSAIPGWFHSAPDKASGRKVSSLSPSSMSSPSLSLGR